MLLTTIMKWAALGTLAISLFLRLSPDQRIYADFVIAAAAVFGLVQAVNLRKYWWAGTFGLIACLFNPIWKIAFSSTQLLVLQVGTATLFLMALGQLRVRPRMTIASITEATPNTESL